MDSETRVKQEQAFELELRDIVSRDWQLWSLGILVLLVLALGFLSLEARSLFGINGIADTRYLPQLFSGFIALIVLFNLYVLDQKRRLNATRDQLLRRILREDRGQGGLLLDPLTRAFSPQYFEQAVARETSRAERQHSALSLLVVDLSNAQTVTAKFGEASKEHLLMASAELLRSSLRGSDTVCRYGSDRFVVILPDTNQAQSTYPAARLSRAVADWNRTTNFQYKIKLQIRVIAWAPGHDLKQDITQGSSPIPMAMPLSTAASFVGS